MLIEKGNEHPEEHRPPTSPENQLKRTEFIGLVTGVASMIVLLWALTGKKQ